MRSFDWDRLIYASRSARPSLVEPPTGPAAASYSEFYRLGEIVDSATANGNKAEITEPTGCRITFSGARVTKHDGTRQHLIGIQPTIPASRTIAGVIAGRDEYSKQRSSRACCQVS